MNTNNDVIRNGFLNSNGEIHISLIISVLFRYKYVILSSVIIGALVGGALSKILYKKMYKAESYIFLKSSGKVSDSGRSQANGFILDIVRSTYDVALKTNQLLENVVNARYEYTIGGKKQITDLTRYYNSENLSDAIARLKKSFSFSFDRNTCVLKCAYSDENPEIAADVINNIVLGFDAYYNSKFVGLSSQNLDFLAASTNDARKELDDARNKLEMFINTNKQLNDLSGNELHSTKLYSSNLALLKLKEDVEKKMEAYKNFQNKYDQLKSQISENVPTITILEKAIPPTAPVSDKCAIYCLSGALIGLIVSGCYAILKGKLFLFTYK